MRLKYTPNLYYTIILMRLFLHFIENGLENPPVDTYVADLDSDFTIQQLLQLATANCKKELDSSALNIFKEFGQTPPELASQVSSTFKDNDDVFLIYEGVKAVRVEKAVNETFVSITKYSFLDDDKKVL